jgi:outer membrane protein
MSRLLVRASLLLSLAACSVAHAQTVPTIAPDKPLTLEDTIAIAVRKNFDLQIQANTLETNKENLTIAQAAFDPTINSTARRSVSQSASNTSRLDGAQTEGARSDSTTLSVGASERLAATNGTLSVTTNVSRSATNSTNALFNPQFGNGVSASLSQPLLQNAGSTVAKANVERSKLGLGIAYLNYRNQVLTLISQTETAYYNLVAARETLRIRQLSLDTSQKFLEEARTRQQTGVAIPLDVLSAENSVANAQRAQIQAVQTVKDSEDALLSLINVANLDSAPGPVKFDDYRESAPDFATVYKRIRESYPPNLTQEETLKQLLIDLETARRNQLPSLNLDASLGYTAKATNQSYGQAVANLPNDHGNNWALGLTYSMPWGRHADKARYRQALLNVNSQKLRIDQAEEQLMVQVRQAVRTVETNIKAVEFAAKATQLSEAQYNQQAERFKSGLATAYLVQQSQDTLESNRFNELSAKLTLRRAVSELNRLQGTSIEKYRIQLPQ